MCGCRLLLLHLDPLVARFTRLGAQTNITPGRLQGSVSSCGLIMLSKCECVRDGVTQAAPLLL